MLCKIVLLAVLFPVRAKKGSPAGGGFLFYTCRLAGCQSRLVFENKHADGGEERGDADPHAYLSDTVVVVG